MYASNLAVKAKVIRVDHANAVVVEVAEDMKENVHTVVEVVAMAIVNHTVTAAEAIDQVVNAEATAAIQENANPLTQEMNAEATAIVQKEAFQNLPVNHRVTIEKATFRAKNALEKHSNNTN